MYHKHHLLVNAQVYDITGRIKNWDDISSNLSRNDYDGLEQIFSSKFEFTGQAYTLIKAEYESRYLQSNATIVFSLRNNSWEFNEKFRCRLDFSTYTDDGSTITMSGIDSSMKSIIKANGGTEYEINVDDIKDGGFLNTGNLNYDRLEIEQSVTWIIAADSTEDGNKVSLSHTFTGTRYRITIPLYIKASEILHGNKVDFKDLEFFELGLHTAALAENGAYFIKALANVKLNMNISFKCYTSIGTVEVSLVRLRPYADRSAYYTYYYFQKNVSTSSTDVTFNGEVSLEKDDILSLAIISAGTPSSEVTIFFTDAEISTTWLDRRTSTIDINLIYPSALLTKILQCMTGTTETKGVIDTSYDTRLENTMLCAAESIRGISGAKIYTSFNKFRDWMKSVFGYVYEISGDNVTFRHRSAYFDKTKVVKTISRYNGYEYSVNSGIIYSMVKAGFDQRDYEKVNGRDEFRFGSTYTTGITLTDKELNLISPYRADAIGFEILTTKRGENTTNNTSDKDIFMVGTKWNPARPEGTPPIYRPGYYTLDRSISASSIYGLISPSTQFNLMFTPRRCIEANKEMIGACTNDLTFASNEGNSGVIIGGVSESGDIEIAKSDCIFRAGLITVTIPDIDVPDNLIGVVEIERGGSIIRGFVDELELAQGKRQETKYKLIEIYE